MKEFRLCLQAAKRESPSTLEAFRMNELSIGRKLLSQLCSETLAAFLSLCRCEDGRVFFASGSQFQGDRKGASFAYLASISYIHRNFAAKDIPVTLTPCPNRLHSPAA